MPDIDMKPGGKPANRDRRKRHTCGPRPVGDGSAARRLVVGLHVLAATRAAGRWGPAKAAKDLSALPGCGAMLPGGPARGTNPR